MAKAIAVGALAVLTCSAAQAAPLTQDQILDLLGKGVSEDVVRSLVERDCVDFKVEAANAAELAGRLPTKVLQAAIDCRASIDSTPRAALAVPDLPPLSLADVRVVAIVPTMVNGVADGDTTSYLVEQIRTRKVAWKLLEPTQLQLRAETAGTQRTAAPLRSLMDAARSLGAQAILLSDGSASSGGFGDFYFTLQLQLFEVNAGKVLWSDSGNAKGGGLTREHSAHMAVRSVTRKLPR